MHQEIENDQNTLIRVDIENIIVRLKFLNFKFLIVWSDDYNSHNNFIEFLRKLLMVLPTYIYVQDS